MARPTRCRRVCHFPETLEFSPKNEAKGEPIVLTIDEFETIRLIDKEGLSQKECGEQLEVGRTTAQRIYENARKKLADALVLGRPFLIEGGDITLCNGNADFCYKKSCIKRQFQTEFKMDKGENVLRIAVTYKDGVICQRFGHTEQFKVYDVNDNKITKTEVIDTNGSGHGVLAGVLAAIKADVLICGGIGGGAQMALREANIKLYGGVSGNPDNAVNAFLAGSLNSNPDMLCSRHGQNSEAYACGEHRGGGHICNN